MNRRSLLLMASTGIASALFARVFAKDSTHEEEPVPLVTVDLPSPAALRGGWAALAAVFFSRGWTRWAHATPTEWLYDDGGGNWLVLRYKQRDQVVILGQDHEYSRTYFREAAEYFREEETDLLAGAPDWWSFDLDPLPHGNWVAFVYGWDGEKWQRAAYDKQDGFEQVGLRRGCSLEDTELLQEFAADAPGLNGRPPSAEALQALVDADADITAPLLEAVVPGWDIDAGVAAGRRFLEMPL